VGGGSAGGLALPFGKWKASAASCAARDDFFTGSRLCFKVFVCAGRLGRRPRPTSLYASSAQCRLPAILRVFAPLRLTNPCDPMARPEISPYLSEMRTRGSARSDSSRVRGLVVNPRHQLRRRFSRSGNGVHEPGVAITASAQRGYFGELGICRRIQAPHDFGDHVLRGQCGQRTGLIAHRSVGGEACRGLR